VSPFTRASEMPRRLSVSSDRCETTRVIGDRSVIVLTGFPLRFQPGERRQLSVGMQFVELIRDCHFHVVEGHIGSAAQNSATGSLYRPVRPPRRIRSGPQGARPVNVIEICSNCLGFDSRWCYQPAS
jgi:hypothetical protein